MNKSFLEIAREIAELVEGTIAVPDAEALQGQHCPYCTLKELDDDDHECAGFEPDLVAEVVDEPIVDREAELAIEAILRREFGDNNGPALERSKATTSVTEAKISKRKVAFP